MNRIKALLILAVLLCVSALAATTLLSVRAVDDGKTASRIAIRLSDPVNYSFNASGQNITVSLPGVKLGASAAQYRRLSHVIDYISLSEDESGSYITIRTMDQFKVSHNDTGSGLVVQVGTASPVPEVQPPPAVVRPKTKFAPAPPQVLKPVPIAPLADSLSPADSIPAPAKLPAAKPKTPLWKWLVKDIKANPLIWGIVALLIFGLAAYLLWPKRAPQKDEEAFEEKKSPDLGLNGATLIMDAETKQRMITKLMDEGWTAKEISQEIKLPLGEVELLAAKSRSGD